MDNFALRITENVFDTYKSLPKRGKPQDLKEWTLLSAIVMKSGDDKAQLKTVSLATGSKCLGKSKMSPKGDVLNDSHAEVLARRALLRFMYDELGKVYNEKESEVFTTPLPTTGYKSAVKPGISFHLFTSHTPCGDASIFPKAQGKDAAEESSDIDLRTPQWSMPTKPDLDHKVTTEIDETRIDTIKTDVNDLNMHNAESPQTVCLTLSENTECLVSHRNVSHDLTLGWSRKRDRGHFEMIDTEETIGYSVVKQPRLHTEGENPDVSDIHRTGAKCVPGATPDSRAPGIGYHTLGALRTKPGRGEKTTSLSCSDKMARWCLLGCQGALLSMFLTQPVYLETIVVGKCPYSEEALARALWSRLSPSNHVMSLPPPFTSACQPLLLQTTEHQFEASKPVVQALASKHVIHVGGNSASGSDDIGKMKMVKIVPSPAAIIWFASTGSDSSGHDVAVNGKRQGITKKDIHKPQARCMVCSLSLFQCFHELVKNIEPTELPSILRREDLKSLTYDSVKSLATNYQQAWELLRQSVFPAWPRKPRDLLQFCADS